MLTARQIDARIRQLAAWGVPGPDICARLLLPWQRVALVLAALQAAPRECAPPGPEPAPPPEPLPMDPAPAEAPPPVKVPPVRALAIETPPIQMLLAETPVAGDPVVRNVLDVLGKVAATAAPCLTNTGIADMLGHNHSRVSAVIAGLVRDGLIRIERRGPRRRITITASGRSTGWSPPPRGQGAVIVPAGFDQSLIDRARRLLMSRDYTVLSAGGGLYRVDGKIRTPEELVAMANRQLVTMGRAPLTGDAA